MDTSTPGVALADRVGILFSAAVASSVETFVVAVDDAKAVAVNPRAVAFVLFTTFVLVHYYFWMLDKLVQRRKG